ncbi:hypothetical protein TL16_g13017 [Triparma laevis f. inornata]|uniref:Uncharacterized protein n=1 Tax=Triparma laevis f. inornata TaxID=1714386 RepID=A0A9W7EWZ4_9STRA|nr:hypothetical protein TL16_g13017 [Triparma laevis f. inornata]
MPCSKYKLQGRSMSPTMPSKETVTAYLNHTAGAAESICDSAQNSDAGSLDSNSRSSSPPIHDGIHDGIHDNSSNASNASNASNDQQDEEQDDGCRRYCGVLRLPISFKTRCNGNVYRHIILAVYAWNGVVPSLSDSGWRWGALGISRRKTLMFKDMKYSTLGKLVKTFKDSYEASWHTVIKVNLGLPFSYDSEDVSRLYWKLKKVNIEEILGNKSWADCEEIFDSYSRECINIYDYFAYNGKLPEECTPEWIRGERSMKDVKESIRKSQPSIASVVKLKSKVKSKAKSKKKVDNGTFE